ncbi:MAG: hypothetical protein NPIRA02_33650 [Nitrospirales bacterium]|nr:MAG: hypothetical protein NPIRA02_33650 [Nitrospirales bacterium]
MATRHGFVFSIWLIASVLLLVCSGSAFANKEQAKEQIIEHLEFLGYECDPMNQGVKVTHPSKIGFLLVPLKDGIMVQSAFAGIESQSSSEAHDAMDNDLSQLSLINDLNRHASVSRFFWADTGELVIRASILGSYDKRRFSTFMQAWEKDGHTLGQNYENLRPYLK